MTLKKLLIWIGAAALLLVLGVVLADAFVLPAIIHAQSEVLVPELSGLSQEDARTRLHDLGLELVLGEELYSEELPPGVVVEQSPRAMTSVRRGRPVRIVLSKGEPLARVPDLSGMSLRQAELTLPREGLTLGRVSRSYDPRGALGVIAQRPAAGQQLARESAVHVMLRQGHDRAQLLMPDLRGRSLARAREELSRAGFELGRVTYRSEGASFPGTILDQWPPAGAQVPAGGNVELVAASRG